MNSRGILQTKALEHFTDPDSECLTDSALGEFYLPDMPVLSADEDQHAFQRRMDEYYMGIALSKLVRQKSSMKFPLEQWLFVKAKLLRWDTIGGRSITTQRGTPSLLPSVHQRH